MKNMPRIALCVFLLLCSHAAQACYNKYTIERGEMTAPSTFQHIIGGDMEGGDINDAVHATEARYKASHSLEDYSDYGVALCYMGEYAKAMRIFMEIEKKKPNLYQSAANIGTTYELLGKLDSALFWIKKGLRINPNSHEGSEWIHIKILEHEIAAKGDAQYSLTHSVLGFDFGSDTIPKHIVQNDILAHLIHQLVERVALVKPTNTVVGQLLCDYGNLYLGKHLNKGENYDYESILSFFYRAQEYGYTNSIMEKRMAFLAKKMGRPLENKLPKPKIVVPMPATTTSFYEKNSGLIGVLLAALCAIIGVFVLQKRRRGAE